MFPYDAASFFWLLVYCVKDGSAGMIWKIRLFLHNKINNL